MDEPEVIAEFIEPAAKENEPASRKKKSEVHEHFTWNERTSKWECNHCNSKYAPEKRGGTSNRKSHLVLKHPQLTSSWNIVDSPSSNTGIKKYFPKQNEVQTVTAEEHNKLLMEFIILQNQSFSVVQAESFVRLINYGRDSPFKIPKKDAIKTKLIQLYDEKKDKIKTTLSEAPSKISLVVDCWSTKNMKSFQSILATWVDSDWNYQQVVLDMDVLQSGHSGKSLAESIFRVLNEYEIQHKLLALTCDNASNMDKMMEELARLLKQKDIVFNPKDSRIRCLAHIIILACQASINILKDVGKKNVEASPDPDDSEEDQSGQVVEKQQLSIYDGIKRAIRRIKTSVNLKTSLEHFCDTFEVQKLELVLDTKVRWNSSLHMLRRSLLLKKPLTCKMKTDAVLSKYALEDSGWNLLEQMVAFLTPFDVMTNQISTQQIPTRSLAALIYVELYNHLEAYSVQENCNPLILLAAQNACEKLNKYYPKTDGLVYIMGIVFDPRCKLEWHKAAGFKNNVSSYKKEVIRVWKDEYKPVQEDLHEDAEKPDDLFDCQMKKARLDSRDELVKYLAQHPVKSTEVPNGVLAWWKEHEFDFPNLAKMARDYLGVSATGVPAECLFSTGTDLLAPKRLKMLADTIRISMCLKGWIKFQNWGDLFSKRAEAVAQKIRGEYNEAD